MEEIQRMQNMFSNILEMILNRGNKNEKNEMKTIGSKPIGWLGTIAGRIMNGIHIAAYRKIITHYISQYCSDSNKKTVLDIGCGGGSSVKFFMILTPESFRYNSWRKDIFSGYTLYKVDQEFLKWYLPVIKVRVFI